jgi:flagellar biosynthesis GTPase FlhF
MSAPTFHANILTPIFDGTTFSTTTLDNDKWANQRLFKYDHTLRTAYSDDEKREANALIDNLKTARGVLFYEKNMWRMFPGTSKSPTHDLFANKFNRRHDQKAEYDTRAQQIKEVREEIAVLWKREQDYREQANAAKNEVDAIDGFLNDHVEDIKKVFKENQLIIKADDEKRKARKLAEEAPSGNPQEELKYPNVSTVIQKVPESELRIWKLRTCYKCGKIGHGRKHHQQAKKSSAPPIVSDNGWGVPVKPWGSWKSKSPSHNRYVLLMNSDL